MLTLPIKRKWFDMILSGEKKEEYRDTTPYYKKRFETVFGRGEIQKIMDYVAFQGTKYSETPKKDIMFRNGYGKIRPSFVATVSIRVGTGKPEWGAEPGKVYYVLTIHEIIKFRR